MKKKIQDKQFTLSIIGLIVLQLVMASVKLFHVFDDWSWWFVTIPVWGSFLLLLLLLIAIWIAVAIERRKMDRRITITKRK